MFYAINCVDCFAGDDNVGKTCIIHRLCTHEFPSFSLATVGVAVETTTFLSDGRSTTV